MSLLDDLKNGALEAAKNVRDTLIEEASKDAIQFVEMAFPSIQRYIVLRLSGKITEDEFESLLKGLLALAEMKALTVAGLGEIEIDKTRNFILKTVTSIAIGAVSKIGI
jgi:hypothetical protein